MTKDLSKFRLALKGIKAKVERDKIKILPPKKLTKLVNGIIVENNGVYNVAIKYEDYKDRLTSNTIIDEISKSNLITIPLTEESYLIKDNVVLFNKKTKDCIIRNETQRIFGSFNNEKYIPFVNKTPVKGWIVRVNNIIQFKFRNVILNTYDLRHKLLDDEEFHWFNDIRNGKK